MSTVEWYLRKTADIDLDYRSRTQRLHGKQRSHVETLIWGDRLEEAGSVAKLCQQWGMIQWSTAVTERVAASITLLWSNPMSNQKVTLGELCPDLPQIVNGQE
ncbi:hypothetical protein A3D81_01920 [Candidatus Curtissbacteria bacterium RIFCSPHIGHO2_02_FULL_40_17]|uniref:Uncharacterized protein n=1 Tax=Candidatus Curtissbacteria bacterium RIFCSPHIGHO2_02_FULL_40_17 TaxID=1797715 RepID=A0A1F5GGR6_9BACT|nr:MAG: hypothetical protein A3D81_01920 [Candidatus Curtissbacteria bacterium RIFCSPHIGHO2_02_FULL_40_17]